MTPIKFKSPDFAGLAENLDCRLQFNAKRRPAAALPPSRRMVRKPEARRFLDLRGHAEAARRLIRPLPKPGESVHILTGGEFVLSAIVPDMLDAIGPCALRVSSLGINQPTAAMFAELLATGQLTSLDVVLSHFFANADKDTFALIRRTIEDAGGRVIATRSHTKIATFEPQTGPGRYVFEGSGNLRSSQNAEQLTVSNDDALFKFYHRWFNEILK